ncbi:hypothetical protein OpiT1DRAFT_00185 [Opitutaceae bacterium TAV1]|nr:hypothetical protein OpiT1DRAFT_00185 [Opitutaceae bacterium TAV1]
MTISKTEIERLATAFRNAPASPSHKHADVWNTIEKVGGRAAIVYGMFLATPFRQRWKKRDLGLDVASALDAAANTQTGGGGAVR